jgi:3-phenylpropionate/trans-cinnamate dioxygenase ferredoxin subunit
MNWIKLFPLTILSSDDFLKQVNVAGKKLCIVKTEGKLFAIQNKCPHAGAQLSNGWCSKGAHGQSNYVDTYPIEIQKDGVYIGIKKSWWKFW